MRYIQLNQRENGVARVFLKYYTLNHRPIMVYPKVLFPPDFSIKDTGAPHVLKGPFLAGYTAVDSPPLSYGLQRLDHAVGNVHKLQEAVNYIQRATGFHQFAEFTAEVGLRLASRNFHRSWAASALARDEISLCMEQPCAEYLI